MTLEELQKKMNKRIRINKKRGKSWKTFCIPPKNDYGNTCTWGTSGKTIGKNFLRIGI